MEMPRRSFVLVCAALGWSALLAASGCSDPEKKWRPRAQALVDKIAGRVETDVGDVRKGLPEAAKKLAAKLPAEPDANREELQREIAAARNASEALSLSKITALAFADGTGKVLRSESNPDLLAHKNVLGAFPELAKAKDGSLAEGWGEMTELRVAKTGPDAHWVLANGVGDKGILFAGFSLCGYARFLEDQAKREAREQTQAAGEKNEPVLYVFVHKGKKAIGAPLTPEVNTQKIQELDVVSKLPFEGKVEITNRTFFVSSRKAAALGDDAAISVMLSGV